MKIEGTPQEIALFLTEIMTGRDIGSDTHSEGADESNPVSDSTRNEDGKVRVWLKTERKKNGYTIRQMADALRISKSGYCSIENGSRQKDMDVSIVNSLSKILGISVENIVRFETDAGEPGSD